jgi:hypothetical protein
VHHDVGAVLERPHQVRGGDGVVDDERHAVLVGHGRLTPREVEEVVAGVADGLAEEGLGVGRAAAAPGVEVVGVLDEVTSMPILGSV